MAYFNLKCLDPAIGKYIIIALNAVVAIMGIIHFACKLSSYFRRRSCSKLQVQRHLILTQLKHLRLK